jgi:hypothetical protein
MMMMCTSYISRDMILMTYNGLEKWYVT